MPKIATSNGILEIKYDQKNANAKGEIYIVCPICTPYRKEAHKNDKKLAININKSPTPWRCNHCGEAGYILDDNYIDNIKIKPLTTKYDYMPISDTLAQWFWEKRKISINTVRHFKMSMSMESIRMQRVPEDKKEWRNTYQNRRCMNFKYFLDEMLINIKFRDRFKNFKMINEATLIPYNMDSIKDSKEAVIVEGELDAMAYHEAGIKNVISVPNGATITQKEKEHYETTGNLEVMSHINLEYLDPIIDRLNHIEMFYIATDDDAPGIKLREELARRLDYSRCKYIKFGNYFDKGKPMNDPNDVLFHLGKEKLADTIKDAISFPIMDVTTADQYLDKMLQNYRNGKSRGLTTGYKTLDPYFTWVRGWPYVINGYPNMGKTSFILNLMVISSVKYKWKWGVYCPENYPVENVAEIIAQNLLGKTVEEGYNKRISEKELIEVTNNFIRKYFFFVDNEEGFTPKQLREIKKRLIKEHGIIGFLTDPWSSLIHDPVKHGGIDEYLNFELNNEVRLTTQYNLINLICHHPRTPDTKSENLKPPMVHQLTGGKAWWMKMYFAITIHQESFSDWKNNRVGIHVQKVKDKQRAGETTNLSTYPILRYDKLSRRFYELEDPEAENKKYSRFPFSNYLEGEQQELFEGF